VAKPSSSRRGRPQKEAKEYDEEVIQIDRVTRVVKGGRRLRFRATVVVGNRKGKVGIGIGKSTEVQGAIQKAIAQAKKVLIEVPIVGQTIPHRIQIKHKSAKLLLMPACPGTGIIAGGPLRKVVELAGIQDILSKSLGCNNRVTNTQAALIALSKLQKLPWLSVKTTTVVTPAAVKAAAAVTAKEPVKEPVVDAKNIQAAAPKEKTEPIKESK
jgi:small subunit ribosomal protein S5